MEWKRTEVPSEIPEMPNLSFETTVPVKCKHGTGEYFIWIQKRPTYCDRGDWQIGVDPRGQTTLDCADGFPRYFFGTEDEVKRQMETWAQRRAEVRAAFESVK